MRSAIDVLALAAAGRIAGADCSKVFEQMRSFAEFGRSSAEKALLDFPSFIDARQRSRYSHIGISPRNDLLRFLKYLPLDPSRS
jgi:hypothetical protein